MHCAAVGTSVNTSRGRTLVADIMVASREFSGSGKGSRTKGGVAVVRSPFAKLSTLHILAPVPSLHLMSLQRYTLL